MSRRRFQPQAKAETTGAAPSPLPTDKPIAVYYRQSTTAQVGNISTAIQKIDMVEHVGKLGWSEENIWLIDTDEGVSGQRGIDEREGMKTLYNFIVKGEVGAVACQDEDRLFRDMTQIHVNVFIAACRTSAVQLITPFFTYDFAHSLYGEYHARQFRFKCEMAAEYIKSYILGRLVPAKKRIAHEGKWFGQGIPVGFMVDMRKELPGGGENPAYRKFVPFEPYAEIVRAYFQAFLDAGGAVRTAMRTIFDRGLSFPDCPPPTGFKVNYKFRRRAHGAFPNRANILNMLTNPAYIGHWMHKGEVLIWNNHTPLIDVATFTRAFNYLSRVTMTGEENPHYNPAFKYQRHPKHDEGNHEIPLLIGILGSYIDGVWTRASHRYDPRCQTYLYTVHGHNHFGCHALWARRVPWIDQAIISRFRRMVSDTYESDIWTDTVEQIDERYERERQLKLTIIAAIEDDQRKTVSAVSAATLPNFVLELEKRYQELENEKKRLRSELLQLEAGSRERLSASDAKAIFKATHLNWDALSLADQKTLLGAFIERVVASDFTRAGAMRIEIHWRDGATESFELGRKPHEFFGALFTVQEEVKLLSMFDAGCGQLEIAREFPNHKWYQIFTRIKKHRGVPHFTLSYLSKDETYNELIAKGGGRGRSTPSKWLPAEEETIRQLVIAGACQEELMKALPYRKWIRIQSHISMIFGKGTRVKLSGISQKLSYNEYVGREIDCNFESCSEIVKRCCE